MRQVKLLIIPSIFFFSGFSFATTQPLVTIGELEAQQNRNILLQAKVQGAQLQKQLEDQMLLHHLKLFQVSLV
ncbi:type IV pilus biogenesis protein PilP [Escherichia coli]|uniref:Type IV pilus biogenesis protein PilP n=1 Tax=Escherichia coli TaxID=562 RepID=A0A376ZX46_ECOLX|nr:type IV pilus biogenesis protein PilP [Escherichia coli]